MQIDFHHATIYVLARLAGFKKSQAEIIAYASQYVDDATRSGIVHFDNKALYSRTSSAHPLIDYRNTMAIANRRVWLPFHFLPGNGGMGKGRNPEGSFIHKIICTPNSRIAQRMVADAILQQERPYGLHRFGIVLHVFADTFSHQGFAGVIHDVNEVEDVRETGNSGVFSGSLKEVIMDALDDTIPPLGHARASVMPDMPFLSWEYQNGIGKRIQRNNTDVFCEAATQIHRNIKRFLVGDPQFRPKDMDTHDRDVIQSLFKNLKKEDGEKRHEEWLRTIKAGEFSFGSETVAYSARGRRSWKAMALGTSHDLRVHTYDRKFLKSNWKLFHDAVQAHRHYITRDLLPDYGICAA